MNGKMEAKLVYDGCVDGCVICAEFDRHELDYDFVLAVDDELVSARTKFPGTMYVMTALTEEVGELAQALLKVKAGKWDKSRIWEEAVQVAAMAQRVAVEGDTSFVQDYSEPD